MIQKSYNKTPSLYIVPTPIGNLEDITLRALKILKEVDIIFAEDTRNTSILLKHYEIKNKLISSHKYNEEKMKTKEIELLKSGKNIAIVSDAGTPLISDPGYILIKEAIKEKYNVICLPGPTALIPAVVTSGVVSGPFTFYGFLNSKQSKRKTELEKLKKDKYPLVFYEAPHRLNQTLNDILEIFGERKIAISREISKKFEEIIRGKISDILKEDIIIKGEMAIVVDGYNEKEEFEKYSVIDHINKYLDKGFKPKEAIKKVAKKRNISKSTVYKEYVKRDIKNTK